MVNYGKTSAEKYLYNNVITKSSYYINITFVYVQDDTRYKHKIGNSNFFQLNPH